MVGEEGERKLERGRKVKKRKPCNSLVKLIRFFNVVGIVPVS